MIKQGDQAIDFLAIDQNNQEHKLTDYRGNWVLLYFYPKDNTPGCTKEACAIRDVFSEFKKANVIVLGVSKDSVNSHQKFAQKYQLPFILLVDKDKEISKQYQADGLFKRISYLINPQGYIAKIYPKVKPEEHAQEVLSDLAIMAKKS
ncbi:MAG: peroxiredoxin [Patescibacteria group bacterium]|jgi:peroxiredoxin Q/BCP|nr:peroxiredoxin [Patescibacteria group bacterium]